MSAETAGASRRPRKPPIDFVLVTGRRGAGKTTLINRLLAAADHQRSAVILNDFGHTELAASPSAALDDGFVALGRGCVCCAVRGELVGALERLLRDLDNGRLEPVDRVILEADAAADPSAIVAALSRHPYLALRYRTAAIVAAVGSLADWQPDPVELMQAAMADRVVHAGEASVVPAAVRLAEMRRSVGGEALAMSMAPFWSRDPVPLPDDVAVADETAACTAFERPGVLPIARLPDLADHLATVFGPNLVKVRCDTGDEEEGAILRMLGGVVLPIEAMAGHASPTVTVRAVLRDAPADALVTLIDGFMGGAVDAPDATAIIDNPLSIAGFSARPGRR